MPGKIKVKILAGRNLPVMDRSGDTTDAYVEIKFGNTTYKTDVCRKSLNPQWNSEWYRFEVDDAELQDEPLQVRLMDHDTYSANDAIGKVYVNLNPLLLPGLPPAVKNIWTLEATMNSSSGSQGGSVMTGWIPVFDTMHGIRGEVNIIVKVELFSDCNKFRQSSCGVQFFYSPNIPHGYHAQVIHGFVEELVVSDDPEYKWIDKIRTPRASNEARQTLFFKLSGEVQRKIGLKALDLGGNAVIGYVQNFDLEGESGIVARGIGTAVTLVKLQDLSSVLPIEASNIEDLTNFCSLSKSLYDLSESDDSTPLLSHSPNPTPSPRSPTDRRPTSASNRFPRREKTPRDNRRATHVTDHRSSTSATSRQLPQRQSSSVGNVGGPTRKGIPSSLSLADDLISESSLISMLALEDMRGEPATNPFSRGLKNFRYLQKNILPRRVAEIRSKITDSFDDESDQDSNCSSTWSLAGSESTRSSIADLRQSIRRKKFTHKKTPRDGIAALLIRSVHSGFPLDSVIEDRETPTPSPVNLLDDLRRDGGGGVDDRLRSVVPKDSEDGNSNEESASSQIDDNYSEEKILLIGKRRKKGDADRPVKQAIPMMSSSETDTSTSEDEPSESSTNYNILEDSYSPMDPSSPDERRDDPRNRRGAKFNDGTRKIEKSSVRKDETRIDGAKEEDRYFGSVGRENLESSTDYDILEDICSLVEANAIEDEGIDEKFRRSVEMGKIGGLSEKTDFFESSEKIGGSKIEPADEINLLAVSQTDRRFEANFQLSTEIAKIGGLSEKTDFFESSEKIGVSKIELTDEIKLLSISQADGRFEANFPRSTEIEKIGAISEKTDFFEASEKIGVSKIELTDELKLLSISQADGRFEANFPRSTEIAEIGAISEKTDFFESSEKIGVSKIEPTDEINLLSISQADGRFEANFPRSTEIAKIGAISETTDFFESSEKIGVSKIEPTDEINLLSISQADGRFEAFFHRSMDILSSMEDKTDSSEPSEKIEVSTIKPATDLTNLLSISKADRGMETNTDHNNSRDSNSPIERRSTTIDDEKFESDLRRAVEIAEYSEIPAKIGEASATREDFSTDPAIESDRPSTSKSDENFESGIVSANYIGNEIHPPIDRAYLPLGKEDPISRRATDVPEPSPISTTCPTIISVILKKDLEKSVKSEEIKIAPTKADNVLSASHSYDKLGTRDDSRILDDKNPPIGHSLPADKNEFSRSDVPGDSEKILFPPAKHIDDSIGNIENVETEPTLLFCSKAEENLKSDVESYITDDSRSPIDRSSPAGGNLEPSFELSVEVPRVADLSISSALIPPPPVQRIGAPSVKKERFKIERSGEENPTAMLRDCHSTSSTNYNFLDEIDIRCSPIEPSSLGSGKIEPILPIEVAKPEIQRNPELISLVAETAERLLETTENLPISQSDGKLESSTDHDILDETSPIEPISIDNERSNSSHRRAMEFAKLPEIPSTSILNEKSVRKIDRSLEKSADIVVEPRIEETTSPSVPADVSNLLATPPISPNRGRRVLDSDSSRSPSPLPISSPNPRPKHLKFLPKQVSFDSADDAGFVTSTPVKTDVSVFPDFETNEATSPRRSFESTRSVRPSTIFPAKKKSVIDDEKPSIAEKIGEHSERRVCPLGLSFDKVTAANEIKIGKSSKPSKIEKSATAEVSESKNSRTARPQRKIERTDTVIYKGPPKERSVAAPSVRGFPARGTKAPDTGRPASPIPIIVAPPPEEHTTRLQVPVIRTTNVNVQSTFAPDETKGQRVVSTGGRRLPAEEAPIGEKIVKSYRQQCMIDLIRTIDARMMTHHAHHERRDSTRSRRKRRDRVDASATPSPDSIHRTRSRRRRSRSRSPDRPHMRSKAQVSSLSTHSFPDPPKSPSAYPRQESPSRDSSYDNLAPSNGEATRSKENTISPGIDGLTKDRRSVVAESIAENENSGDRSSRGDSATEIGSRTGEFVEHAVSLLCPTDNGQTVFKSHSAGSLERLRERPPAATNITNNSNTIDDLCVPRSPLTLRQPDEQEPSSPVHAAAAMPSSLGSKVAANPTAGTRSSAAVPNMHRRSSDSDLSITPKGNSLAGSDRSMGGHLRPSTAIVRTMNQDTMEMLEYPFITMQQYPAGFVVNIGGLVSARSVKLLERITNLEEPEGRDAWWTEIRMEVRSHARALACNVVLGYKEEISICDDVCVLNASGTAAVINLLNATQDQDSVPLSRTIMTTSVESERDRSQSKASNPKSDKTDDSAVTGQAAGKPKRNSESNDSELPYLPILSACALCHLPYSESSVPFRVDVSKCAICRRAKVPDVLFTTIELPENIPMTGRGVFLQATVCKCKRDLRGELNAKEISDCLPFLEYELHSLLLNKLKVKGMNAIFGLRVQVSVGERLVIGMAVGTAVYLTALPAPSVPKIASGNSWHNDEQLAEIQKTLIETVRKNREFYRLKPIVEVENGRSVTTSDTDDSDSDLPDLDLGIGTKDACVLEVDDVEDMDRINLLVDERPPDDFHVVNTQTIPGLEDLEIVRNLQMFTQISRAKIPTGQFASMPSKYFARMLQTVLFKLRRMVPCALCDMQFRVALSEQDEIQLSVVGMALGLGEPTRFGKYKRKLITNSTSKDPVKRTDENDMIFSLDEDHADVTTVNQEPASSQSTTNNASNSSPLTGLSAQKHRSRSPFRTRSHMQHRHKHVPIKERYGVDITPLSYLPGGKIERYLGNLNFFFIRESTSIRENGGLSGFTHSFVTEILAIVRAHITALGGNAMVAFFMTQCVLLHSPHKNQGQSLINVGGDVVTVSYYGNDKYQGSQNC